MDVAWILWLALSLLGSYFYGKENGRQEKANQPRRESVNGVSIIHGNGNNCPPFIVQIEHDYPVLWCPFCGKELRHSEHCEEVTS